MLSLLSSTFCLSSTDSTARLLQAMSSHSVADRRRQVLVGELPPDFLRLIVPREQEATSFPQQQVI
ncbi:hypothetical protein ANCCAN_25469 [Ancylostoma caninum]|uniref:Uncharacterized protein n=1 Tax=Ancylostoma caninum TaxID=29170 RepID=A0A368F9J3_ANCCA|nr:hypothetical protein ANCCAN_25469 [Ancylostoma caninum]